MAQFMAGSLILGPLLTGVNACRLAGTVLGALATARRGWDPLRAETKTQHQHLAARAWMLTFAASVMSRK
jgi:hypothetical protein